jgi:hypothetical protein
MSANHPQRFGRYVVVRPLGRGAVGEVYLARDPKLDRQVAVKTLSGLSALPPSEQEEARERFLREARAAAALSHPNVVTVFDVGEQDGIPYMAMEYLEGTTLDRHAREGHLLPPAKVVEIGIRAALGLDEAHRAGLVHRDVKPANIVLLADGSIKVADFGLAKDPRSAMTSDDSILGTPNYMSPEQIAGRSLDGRSDLFSLTVAIFELLTGRRPFTGDTVSTVLYRVVNEAPPSLRSLRPELPESLESVVETMLSKTRDVRLANGRELASVLREILAEMGGVPEHLEIPPPATETVSSSRPSISTVEPERSRRRLATLLIATFGLTALTAALWTAPLWAGFDPLAGAREPVEHWMERRLGAAGRLISVGPVSITVPVRTMPGGLEFEVKGRELTRDEAGSLLIPAGSSGTVVLAVDDPCRVGETSFDATDPPDEAVVETRPRLLTMRVNSEPGGARVELDGEIVEGRTPLDIGLEACREHTLVLTADGREPLTVTLPADESEEKWSVALNEIELAPPKPGWLDVPGAPYPVWVTLARSGARLGRAGQRLQLGPGRYQLTLLSPDILYSQSVTATVRSGRTARLDVEYPPVGSLTVRAVPPGGEVLVRPAGESRTRAVGETPLIARALVAGSYEVIVQHPTRGVQVTRTAEIRPGKAPSVVVVDAEAWP